MKISVIGTGYVGLVSGTCFAEIGHEVTCIDVVKAKIDSLNAGKCPIFEPGLIDLLDRNRKSERLQFALDYSSVKNAKVIFIAVGTPPAADGSADLKYLKAAAVSIAQNLMSDAVVVIKSTVPVGTSTLLRSLIAENTSKNFYLVNNPEFLKEGAAIDDFMRPDRVIIGHQSPVALAIMQELYAPLLTQGNPLYEMSNLSAEMSKYAANCFLATKISFINEIARLCDKTGADVEEVKKGIASDKRIGGHFLYPGPGYGGSCFPKDVKALASLAKEHGMELKIVQATEEVNEEQKLYMYNKILDHYNDCCDGKVFAFWGVAFKANTDDVRESAAITMAQKLIDAGAKINIFDPEGSDNFLTEMSNLSAHYRESITAFSNKYDCLNGAAGAVIMTEWREFRVPDFIEMENRLDQAVIFDGRNLYDSSKVLAAGLKYYAVGKVIPNRN